MTDSWGQVAVRTVPGTADALGAIGRMRRGAADLTFQHDGTSWWRTARTPMGAGLQRLTRCGSDVSVEARGPGAQWLIEQAPRLLGCDDSLDGFNPSAHPLVAEAHRRMPGLRIGRSDLVFTELALASIEQLVTGKEAFAGQRALLLRFGDRCGGPANDPAHPAHRMRIPLSAEQWRAIPSWEFLSAGIDAKRRIPLLAGARAADSLERLARRKAPNPDRALRSLPGVGPWTSAKVRQVALGDADAWTIGDYHIGGTLTYILLGEKLDDSRAEEALEPFRGHRYRVELLLGSTYSPPPRHGPRRSLPTHLPTR